jgi:ABC-type multidrug transport system ATPase subunit
LTKPSTILVQPSTDKHAFTGVHVNKDVSPIEVVAGRLPPVQITYSGIKFGVDIKKEKGAIEHRAILKGCDGTFNPGRLTAVMGASGAGKTSLMNIVSGNPTAGRTEGAICLNGIDVFDTMARIRELSAYIQQDDILMGTQTVREAVTLSARLRLPKSMSDEEKLARVADVIAMLGLTKCIDTIIGDAFNKGVSGGEKRRVSMALELIKSPSVLFLDGQMTYSRRRSSLRTRMCWNALSV